MVELLLDFAALLRRVPPLVLLALEARLAELDFAFEVGDFDRPLVEDFGFALELDEEDRLLEDALPLIDHLPPITRCAASATASAISAPSLVALDIIDLAAFSVVSAASIPASRIALRALGLALIAAAAAASPAASISLLIAASPIFAAVDLPEDDFALELLLDFTIADLLFDAIDTRVEQQFRCGNEKKPDLPSGGQV